MEPEQLTALLTSLTGHLAPDGPDQQARLDRVQQRLAQALHTQTEPISNRAFQTERSDLLRPDRIQPERLTRIERLAKTVRPSPDEAVRVFVRDVPVRSTQLAGSVPDWAAGAQPLESIGPILGPDGRLRWFDVFRVERLVALYLAGQATPAILFKARFRQRPGLGTTAVPLLTQYDVVAGSVWFRANLLVPTAPADRYAGLRVKQGTLTLGAAPTRQNGNVVVGAGVNVVAALTLDPQTDPNAARPDAQGADARAAKFTLPPTFSFRFSTAGGQVQAVADAGWTVYGQPARFVRNTAAPSYSGPLSRLLIPMNTDIPDVVIQECRSPFIALSGRAPVSEAFWTLPAAVLNVADPLVAEGAGGLLVTAKTGLRATWQGLRDADARLSAPGLFGEPGRLFLSDLATNAEGATQTLTLWQDELNPPGTTAELTLLANAPLLYYSASTGDELLGTSADARVLTDRPLQVDGEPVAVVTQQSALFFATNADANVVTLFDPNMLVDNAPTPIPGTPAPVPNLIALALENALFTTSEVNSCLLVAYCTDDWAKALRGNLFLGFTVFRYVPTLPDPYAANLGLLARQFLRNDRTPVPLFQLLCQVQHRRILYLAPPGPTDPVDRVDVSFHFGDEATTSDQDAEPRPVANPRRRASVGTGRQSGARRVALNPNVVIRRAEATTVSPTERPLAFTLAPAQLAAFRQEQLRSGQRVEGFVQETAFRATSKVPNYEAVWNERLSMLQNDAFALLDVSTNAHLLGVSFGLLNVGRMGLTRTANVVGTDTPDTVQLNQFPFAVHEMAVQTLGYNSRLFMLPQVAWEPVLNMTPPAPAIPMDPPVGYNFYPNDGGPTRLFSLSTQRVTLAPIPLKEYLLERVGNDPLLIDFTLPFGLKALASIRPDSPRETVKSNLIDNEPSFQRGTVALKGGIQISARAGNFGKKGTAAEPNLADSPMFEGITLQLNNVLGLNGTPTGASTLGDSVTRIFNNEFFDQAMNSPDNMRGVPVSRIDFSGYGASLFSNWLSPSAAFAQTSQARFDVLRGRPAHEVIQVKSILYPWGIRVVRTITLFRASTGYVYRYDSGWQAESEGLFDFRYSYKDRNGIDRQETPYTLHPGMVRGLFNVRNISEDGNVAPYTDQNTINTGDFYINVQGEEIENTGAPFTEQVLCRAVWFDADVEIEGLTQGYVVQGANKRRVPSKKILGYVQLAPAGKPLTEAQFRNLLNLQGGSIGGPIEGVVNVNQSDQQIRLNRFDVNVAETNASQPLFVAAARGSVFLPKDGSWSLVQHRVGTGDVTPLPADTAVPLIRIGEWVPGNVVDDVAAAGQLLRIAHPADLLRTVNDNTLNFGFLQSTDTQKALFLTPAYGRNLKKLLSKTPPLFADAYRLMTGNGIFPNVGDAVTNFGKAMTLEKGVDALGNVVDAFAKNTLQDAGQQVLELIEMQAEKQAEAIVNQGMALAAKGANGLLDKALQFDVPPFEIPLVDIDALKIYIEYKTQSKAQNGGNFVDSKLNFNLDSFAGAMADTWKSRLNNLAMVVDLGPMERLMTIKGNFDARKGKESGYEGDVGDSTGLPTPEIEFSDALQPVIDILELLASLSTGDYGDVMKKGLKLAMSNAGEIWEYKFEAGKDIPLVRFPPVKEVYDNPATPLKLEASMSLGVYFNAALKVTTDPAQLLPSAGAFIQFHGGLQVMCVSVGVGTIYAVGNVDLKIACDTAVGPNLTLAFGFGAQITVGLPVVGNASILFMVGVEMYADTGTIRVAALMLFRGHAELLGGLVGVTITIEAKGIVERQIGGPANCIAEVTFAIDISIFLVIDISFSKTWSESRQIA